MRDKSYMVSGDLIEDLIKALEDNMFYSDEDGEYNNDYVIDVLDRLNFLVETQDNMYRDY